MSDSGTMKARNLNLDMIRCTIVILVAYDHGPKTEDGYKGRVHVERNSMSVNLWWLYSICAVSGMLFAQSRRPLSAYIRKMMGFFVVGVGFNICCILLDGSFLGVNQPQLTMNLIVDLPFQMRYVVGLVVYALICTGLRHACRHGKIAALSCTCIGAVVLLACAEILPFDDGGSTSYLPNPGQWSHEPGFFRLHAISVIGFWFASAYVIYEVEERQQLTASSSAVVAVLGIVFAVPMAYFGWGNGDYFTPQIPVQVMHTFTSYLFGFIWAVVQHAGTEGRFRSFSKAMDSYWMLSIIFLLRGSIPRRVDHGSPEHLGDRLYVAWFEAREGRLTSSNIGVILGDQRLKTRDDLARQYLRPKENEKLPFVSDSCEYGTAYGEVARRRYCAWLKRHGLAVQVWGCMSRSSVVAVGAGYWFPDDVWKHIVSYCGINRKNRARHLCRYHTMMPYIMSMHKLKGVEPTMEYVRRDHNWVLQVLGDEEARRVVSEANQQCLREL
jgi:hypothetical protein